MKIQFDRTPISAKQKNIEAFTRLINLAIQKSYRGRRLQDMDVPGLRYCVETFLRLNDVKFRAFQNKVAIEFSDGDFTISVAGTHRSHPSYPDAVYKDEFELEIYSWANFLQWYDETFKG